MINDFLLELRQALRSALHRPRYAALIVVILAVVIGATTAILTVIDSVLLQALPYPEADRLVIIWDADVARGIEEMNLSMPKVRDWQEQAGSFEKIGVALSPANLILSGVAEPRRLTATLVSPELLQLTGVEAARGRIFRPDENRIPGGHHVVLLSHRLWQQEFDGSDDVIGRQLTLSGASYTVVGVLPDDFVDFPYPAQDTDLWVPATMASDIFGADMLNVRTSRVFVTLALLRGGVTRDDALAELQSLGTNLAAAYPESESGWSSVIKPLRDQYLGNLQPPLIGLAVGAGLLLLVGCANVTSLLLLRASRRQNEIATRMAIGASRARLFRQALLEALTLALSGGTLGILIASSSIAGLARSVPVEWPHYIRISTAPAILAAAFAITVGAGALAAALSILPSLRSRESGALPSYNRIVNPSGGALRRGLVIAEVALAATLLIGAGLMVQSLTRLRGADIGFRPEGLLALQIDVPPDAYTPARLGVLAGELARGVEAVPGVVGGYIWSPQVPGQSSWYTAVRPQDRPELRDDELPLVRFHYVGPGALEGIGLRFVAGRGISGADNEDGAGAIVLSESAARALWPEGGEALGKVVRRWNRERWLTVVGITEDAKHGGRQGPGTDDNLDVYFSYMQEPQTELVVLARAEGDAEQALAGATDAVTAMVPGLPAFNADTMRTRLAQQEAIPRFTALLAASFAATALFLASIGLYGILAYSVCLRTREIGLRVALGAPPRRILREIMRRGLRLAAVGVTVGLVAAFVLTRWLEALLFEISPSDPLTFTIAPLLLLLVAVSACALPARRALRVDPQVALRAD